MSAKGIRIKNRNRYLEKMYFILFVVIGMLMGSYEYGLTANRVYYSNFNSGAFSTPQQGSISIQVGNSSGCTQSPWCPIGGATNPGYYSITRTGYGGTGYCFSNASNPINGGSIDAYPIWQYSSAWPTDEMYVSYRVRFVGMVGESYANTKMYYSRWDGANSYTAFALAGTIDIANESLYYSSHDRYGNILEQSTYVPVHYLTDGNWHKLSFWVKFSTAEVRFWYDVESPTASNHTFYRNYADGSWTNSVNYITPFKEDAGDSTVWSFRDLDEWEVWDGIPTGSAGTPSGIPATVQSILIQ
jgi:hypothetical protein